MQINYASRAGGAKAGSLVPSVGRARRGARDYFVHKCQGVKFVHRHDMSSYL